MGRGVGADSILVAASLCGWLYVIVVYFI